ncbi:MAG: DinB family protein [Pseudomonadota bacterium]
MTTEGTLLSHLRTMANYGRWANAKLNDVASTLTDREWRADGGAYFGSLHGTWNHLLVGDRIWFQRITGTSQGDVPSTLDAVLYDDRAELIEARCRHDDLVVDYMTAQDDDTILGTVAYHNMAGERFEMRVADILGHVFNHQTHHRGQMHALVTTLGRPAPSLDLIYYLREIGAGRA